MCLAKSRLFAKFGDKGTAGSEKRGQPKAN